MIALVPEELEFAEAFVEGEDGARWRSAAGHGSSAGAAASGSSLLEVPAGCHLPRHTDSAEEAVVVIEGAAEVVVGDERRRVGAGGIAVVPADVPHEVHNAGDGVLRFAAVYAAADVVTRYEQDVQPDGGRERRPTG
jgi:quercetin dioxygenase-like cupin family protein